MNRSTFRTIKYMNGSVLFKGQVYEWVRFRNTGSHTRTHSYPKVTAPPPPPPPPPSSLTYTKIWTRSISQLGVLNIQSNLVISNSLISGLSREWKSGPCFNMNLWQQNKIMWKRGEIAPKEQFLLFSTLFYIYIFLTSGVKLHIHLLNVVVQIIVFLTLLTLICRGTDISKCFSGRPLKFEITGVDCSIEGCLGVVTITDDTKRKSKQTIRGLDKSGCHVNIFLISPRKHMLWYSLEAPRQGASNEYPQHMFSWRNNKKYQYFLIEKKNLIKSYDNHEST